jgi:hypothetical protein
MPVKERFFSSTPVVFIFVLIIVENKEKINISLIDKSRKLQTHEEAKG